MSALSEFHVKRFGVAEADRSGFNGQWEEAAARVLPADRNTFFGNAGANDQQGHKKTQLQFDATAAFAAQRFSSVMESLVTPQNSIWHRLVPVDKTLKRNRAVRLFFDELSELLFSHRYRPIGNFVGNSQQVYLGLGVYGNGSLFIDAPERSPGLRYRNIHVGESYFMQNHSGTVDTVYRKFALTARQILQQFPDTTPEAVRRQVENPNQSETKHDVLHCVYPRTDLDPARVDSLGLPWASLYILLKDKTHLAEGGYNTFPYAVARYTQASNEVYGRGPTQHVLPSIKILNEQKKTVLKQGHRVVDPVLLTHDDGTLGTLSLKAGAQNSGGVSKEGRLLVQPLPTGSIAVGDKMMDMEKAIINDAFLISLFQILVDSPQMTATEVLERAREKGMLLAPTAGRLQAEYLGSMIERELDVMASQGIWPRNVPSILQEAGNTEFKIEYDSPMSRMQRAERAVGFMRALDMASAYVERTQDPEALDWFNFDEAMPEILDIQGAPTSWTKSLDEVNAKREARTEAAQQQQAIEAAPSIAAMAKQAGPPQ